MKNPIYKKSEYFHLWIHLILKANHKDNHIIFKGEKFLVKRGQLVASRKVLSQETKIEQSKVKRILKYLKNDQQIDQRNFHAFSLITIRNYDLYQKVDQQNAQRVTSRRPASDQPVTTNKNDKNVKNDKNNIYTYADCLQKWNQFAEKHSLPQIIKITPRTRRGRALNARLKEGLNFDELLTRIEEQPFLLGENKNGWAVDFDFIITASKYQKIIEGGYKRVQRDPAAGAKERAEKIQKRLQAEYQEEEPY